MIKKETEKVDVRSRHKLKAEEIGKDRRQNIIFSRNSNKYKTWVSFSSVYTGYANLFFMLLLQILMVIKQVRKTAFSAFLILEASICS